jgi:hypothetical protein
MKFNATLSKPIILICILGALVACSSGSDDSQSDNSLDGLDMREANVLSVEYDAGQARFDVRLVHADDNENGYADWWQVETLEGNMLGRRELTHAHGNDPFTRSHFITVPAGIEYVVVRGHDQTHSYGGQAIVLELSTGSQDEIDQGAEPLDFSNYPDLGA